MKVLKKACSTYRSSDSATDPVQVYCRLRPLPACVPVIEECIKVIDTKTLKLTSTKNSNSMRNGGPIKINSFEFEAILNKTSSQKDVFKLVSLPLVKDLLHGKNALLFTYGVTSSGKTHTMTGSSSDTGIVTRCLDVIFDSLAGVHLKPGVFKADKQNGYQVNHATSLPTLFPAIPTTDIAVEKARPEASEVITDVRKDRGYSMFMSYTEIYNNYIYDLLEGPIYANITRNRNPATKILREDAKHNVYVSNLTEVEVTSSQQAQTIISTGLKNRRVARTKLNDDSSRSHSILNIRLVQAPLDLTGQSIVKDEKYIIISQLSLVDLAGSERTSRTGNVKDRLRESGNINQSLMSLRQCMEILRDNQINQVKKIVPYRDSKLTHLLKNYFDGKARVRMIVCVNPSAKDYDETMQVMQFATITQDVQVQTSVVPTFVGILRSKPSNNADISKAVMFHIPRILPCKEDNRIIQHLMNYLLEVSEKRKIMSNELEQSEQLLRTRIVDMENENNTLKENEHKYKEKSLQCTVSNRRITELEKTNKTLELENKDLQKRLNNCKFMINCEIWEKNSIKDEYISKLTCNAETFKQQLENTKNKALAKNNSLLRNKQEKLNKIENILNKKFQSTRLNSKSTEHNNSDSTEVTDSDTSISYRKKMANENFIKRMNHSRRNKAPVDNALSSRCQTLMKKTITKTRLRRSRSVENWLNDLPKYSFRSQIKSQLKDNLLQNMPTYRDKICKDSAIQESAPNTHINELNVDEITPVQINNKRKSPESYTEYFVDSNNTHEKENTLKKTKVSHV